MYEGKGSWEKYTKDSKFRTPFVSPRKVISNICVIYSAILRAIN